MMRAPLITLIAALMIFTSSVSKAASWSAFVGAATDVSLPATVRLGVNTWEFGLLTGNFIGADQVFRSGSTYAAFGLGLVLESNVAGGLYAGVGWEPSLFWGLTFRSELNAVVGTNAFVKGGLYVGLGFHF
jgi:hypothetical protein